MENICISKKTVKKIIDLFDDYSEELIQVMDEDDYNQVFDFISDLRKKERKND